MTGFPLFIAMAFLATFYFLFVALQRRPARVTPVRRSYGPTVPPVVDEFDRIEPQGRSLAACMVVIAVPIGAAVLVMFVLARAWA